MKKIITLCSCLLVGLSVQAQNDFPLQFVDKDGQIIPDGTVLEITDYEKDDLFGDILMPTNVWVKNISDETVLGGGRYIIHSISNGWFQTCFPSVCMRQSGAGTYSTGNDAFMPMQIRSMQTEWLPEGQGTCIVTYQLQTFRKVGRNYIIDGDGSTITLYYSYGTTDIGSMKDDKKAASVTYFDLTGKSASLPVHGIYLKRKTYADGTSETQKFLYVNKHL